MIFKILDLERLAFSDIDFRSCWGKPFILLI